MKMGNAQKLELILKGTTAYYEHLVPEVKSRLNIGGLVFIHDSLFVGCKYRCLKCFSDGSNAYIEQLRARGVTPANLDKSARERLIHEAYELGARTVVIAGAGEPLMSPDLDTAIDICSRLKDMKLVVFTNGLLLGEEKIEEYFSKEVSIVFTFDSISEQNYDRLTGTHGNFRTVLNNLESALDLSEKHSTSEGRYKIVPLAVNTNPTLLTYDPIRGVDEVGQIHALINGKATHFVSHLTPNGNAAQNWKLLIGKENYFPNPALKEAEKKYSRGLGGSSRRQDGKCAYIYNGVTQFAGYWMICPNFGLVSNLGRYPEKTLEQHFSEKKDILDEMGEPLCVTRKEKDK